MFNRFNSFVVGEDDIDQANAADLHLRNGRLFVGAILGYVVLISLALYLYWDFVLLLQLHRYLHCHHVRPLWQILCSNCCGLITLAKIAVTATGHAVDRNSHKVYLYKMPGFRCHFF